MSKLNLTLPVKGTITQGFGGNDNVLYHSTGLMGHPGVDVVSTWDDTIIDSVVGFNKKYIYKIINKDNPNLSMFRCVFQIVEADDGDFEVSYGHCHNILCSHGYTEAGSALATEGNTGAVFVNGTEVTEAAKESGSKAGTHVHFQLRALKKVKSATLHSLSAEDGSDWIDEDGWHFDPINYDNGFNGCINPIPYIKGIPNPTYKFMRDLSYGSFGSDVLILQQFLSKLGFANYVPTGFFGSKTRASVILYQKYHNIIPAAGYVGSITRASLNLGV